MGGPRKYTSDGTIAEAVHHTVSSGAVREPSLSVSVPPLRVRVPVVRIGSCGTVRYGIDGWGETGGGVRVRSVDRYRLRVERYVAERASNPTGGFEIPFLFPFS